MPNNNTIKEILRGLVNAVSVDSDRKQEVQNVVENIPDKEKTDKQAFRNNEEVERLRQRYKRNQSP